METNHDRRCCGIDVHQKTVVVCVLAADGTTGKPVKKVYGTFRNELTRMRVWLKQLRHRRGDGIDRRLLATGVERSRLERQCALGVQVAGHE